MNQIYPEQQFLSQVYEVESQGFADVILKVASRCNLACTYCYWFRDKEVYQMPGVIKPETFSAFLNNFKDCLHRQAMPIVRVIFHGGEPLLLKKQHFANMCESLAKASPTTIIKFGITTNGVLLDDGWVELFKKYRFGVSISLDADKVTHDKSRVSLRGKGTYDQVIKGIQCLQRNGHKSLSLLCVCDPGSSPIALFQHFFDGLGVKRFDVLIPDFNHDDRGKGLVQPIADFYIELFNVWIERYWSQGARVRILEAFVKAVFLRRTQTTGIGVCPTKAVNINPDGTIEPYDVLRINGNSQVNTGLNVFQHSIADIVANDLWLYYLSRSLTLPTACQQCDYRAYCRGGNVIHRYSSQTGYDNPSVHCASFKKIYAHILSAKQKLYEIGMIES